jgi:predicted TIM-barrel fold metal-dependent hydrolase
MEKPEPTRAIDVWAQPAKAEAFARLPEIARLFQQSGSAAILDKGMSGEDMVAMMDRGGVERMLLCAWCRPGAWVYTNDTIAEMVREFPDRFTGVATVDLEKPVQAVRELERAVCELGFKALRIVPWLWNRPPNDKLYYPLYVKCIELGIPFCTQVGHTGPLMPSEVGRPVPYLDEVALTFPGLKIVAGHIGYPWTDEMIGLAWKHENVFIDTSAWLPRYYPFQLQQYMQTYGKTKVLFGSNFPQLLVDKCAKDARELGMPAEVEALFLRDNAKRVFNL